MIKHQLFLIAGFCSFLIAHTQSRLENKAFKVDLGFAVGQQSPRETGFLMYAEPSYTLAGKYKLGLRLEQGFFPMKQIGSESVSFDYFLYHRKALGLYAGAGLSNFSVVASGGCDPGPGTVNTVRSTKHAGTFVRTGFEFQHFRLGIEYNFIPSTYVSAVNSGSEATGTVIYKNNYLTLKAGVLIGGGKKKNLSHAY